MGQSVSYSYMNLWSLSSILRSSLSDVEKVIIKYEKELFVRPVKLSVNEDNVKGNVSDNNLKTSSAVKYFIYEEDLINILNDLDFNESDATIYIDFFRMIDKAVMNKIDLKDLMISMICLNSSSLEECISYSLKIVDRDDTTMIQKSDLHHLFSVMNDTCCYIGDKYMREQQITDLVDSIYTSAGMIDGDICYLNIIEYVINHPIVEIMMSPQFQGPVRNKLYTDEEIEILVNSDK